MRTKARYDAIKRWATWIGKATLLQYSNDFEGCDHDLRSTVRDKTKPCSQKVRVPEEAKILRRMPWAKASLGTVDYTGDLWQQESKPQSLPAPDVAMQALTSSSSSVAEARYVELFHKRVHRGAVINNKRLIPYRIDSEIDQWLEPSKAMGHVMWTAGLGKSQYYWCDLCSSYTGQRAQKLTKSCDRTTRNVRAVNQLRLGINPIDNTALAVRPRRLTRRDIGDTFLAMTPNTLSDDEGFGSECSSPPPLLISLDGDMQCM